MDRYTFFSPLPRSEPGGSTFTSAYLTPLKIKADWPLLDLHCASGDRATWLARSRGCRIVCVDAEPRYMPVVRQRTADGGAGHLVQPVVASYDALPFADESFRVVLAESAALSMGLQKALTAWRRLVAKNDFVAVTYPGVVNKDAPPEVREPLERRMVEPLRTLADYHTIVRNAGYELVQQVPLQPELWDAFYADAIRRAWALTAANGSAAPAVPKTDPLVREVLAEAHWYRRVGRGRVFLQAMLLKRVR